MQFLKNSLDFCVKVYCGSFSTLSGAFLHFLFLELLLKIVGSKTYSFTGEMIELMNHSFWFYGFSLFGIILIRYFLIAGGTHILLHQVLKQFLIRQGVYLKKPVGRSIRRDIRSSIVSAVIFALCAALIISAYDLGETRLYSDFQQHGWWYLGGSFITVLLLQDTYFYFIHRLFHQPLLFKHLHQGHHRSGDPTPWTSFAFDPPEALAQALFLVGVVFVMPLHFVTLLAIIMTMTVWSVINHLGLERFPPSALRAWLGQFCIGSTHHLIHHRRYTFHYGLYFTFWDKLLGTHDPSYERLVDDNLASLQDSP